MNAARVLIADPDDGYRSVIARQLERHGYQVQGVGTAGDAIALAGAADVALLNIDLPDADGLRLCRQIRCRPDVVIIVYTCAAGELDHVLAFQAGADHCVPQQTGIREIVARIDAVQRRVCRHPVDGAPTEDARPDRLHTTVDSVELVVDRVTCTVTRGDEVVPLTRKEFDLLSLLVEQAGRNVTRDTLMERVWRDESGIRTRTLDTHVNNVRRKIGSREAVSCVRGIGYRFEPS
ncbi:response regulator transcription factor [Lolliginicoccus levis]|uniref:response regulator transcription factor n=1 Tax=Lolliginicoccus levis TaxID=2919542 RepID=UPI00241D0A49|nr:response regulator transcription factor [Lolliginicoccus levis]